MRRALFLSVFLLSGAMPARPQVPTRVAVLSTIPFTAPDQQLAALEKQVAIAPDNLEARTQLISLYTSFASLGRPDYRVVRLNHIRYVIGQHPEDALAASSLLYVGNSSGPYANPDDHASLTSLWLTQASSHFDDPRVLLNAVRFLGIEDKPEAEDLLVRAIAAHSENTELASHLGFLYAAGLVGADTLDGRAIANPPADVSVNWTAHCHAELDRSTAPHVLMGASIALPNLAMRRTGGGPGYEAWVRYSEDLRARATAIDRVAGGVGAMPVEFGMFAAESQAAAGAPPPQPPVNAFFNDGGMKKRRVGVISSPPPVYPEEARKSRIEGIVRLRAVIDTDGKLTSAQLISGPPLLVAAAIQAVQLWRWQPTILNGVPVVVTETIEVPFTLPQQ